MASLEELENMLGEAAALLDKASGHIRDLKLNPRHNVRKIGEVLTNIFEIRLQMYDQRPDLTPDYLKKRDA